MINCNFLQALAKLKYLTIYKLNEPKPGLFSKHSCGPDPENYNKPFDIGKLKMKTGKYCKLLNEGG